MELQSPWPGTGVLPGNPWKCSGKCSGKPGVLWGCSRECSGKPGVLQGVLLRVPNVRNSQAAPPVPSEAQQRYFSYRAILAAIVSQNSFVLVFMGYRTLTARYVAKWGIAHMRPCETSYQGGVSHHSGGVLTSLEKYCAIWGIAAIVSQYRAIWGH